MTGVQRLGAERTFLIAYLLLNALLLFGLLPDSWRLASVWATAFILVVALLRAAPSRLLLKDGRRWWDALLLIACLLVNAPSLRLLLSSGADIAVPFILGCALLLVLPFLAARRRPIHGPSGTTRTVLSGFALELFFLVAVFSVALAWLALSSYPLFSILLGGLALWLTRRPPPLRPLRLALFALLFAGLFLLRYLTDGAALLRTGFPWNGSITSILTSALVFTAYASLLFVPAYMWLKAFRLRTRAPHEAEHRHYPDISGWLLAAILTSLTAALVLRPFAFKSELPFFAAALQAHPALGVGSVTFLVLLGCLFVVLLTVTTWKRARSALMAILFLSCLVFLAAYAYTAFMAAIRYSLAETLTLLASGSFMGVFSGAWLLLILLAQLFILVLGYVAFAYELARE